MTHTPGPWTRDGLRIKSARGYICKVLRPQEGGTFDVAANAALIAVAPDMAEALKPFAAMADFYFSHDDDHVVLFGTDGDVTVGDIRRARAALERAKGAEQ